MSDEKKTVLSMRHINKTFPGVKALSDAQLTLREGEIHALMGENGAGKSTLIKVLTGVEEFETGEIIMDGKSIINTSPQEAGNNGISTVYQEVNLCPNLTVAENIFIGREPMKMGRIDWKTMNTQAQKILDNLELEIDATQELENYSVAIQQMVAIARAVDIQSKVLILDEPTSSLDEGEVEKLFKVMNMLKKRGTAIVFVTHFLEQVYAVCDRITVLRNGHFVGEYKTEETICNDPQVCRIVDLPVYYELETNNGNRDYRIQIGGHYMNYNTVYVGMDVHKESFTLCSCRYEDEKASHYQRTPASYKNVLRYLAFLRTIYGEDTRFVCGYEAGCLGYSLYHQLENFNVECVILAPTTMLEQRSKRRIKTDKRDAEIIARSLAQHNYSPVHIPTETDNQTKEFIRMRDDHKAELKKIKQQILSFCLRQGYQYDGSGNWTAKHVKWLRSLKPAGLYKEILDEYLLTYTILTDKLNRLDQRIEELASKEEYKESVSKLTCFLGIKTHTALSVIVEVGDFQRFVSARKFAGYLGLVPGQHSSGDDRNGLGITKAGNTHVRRLLVESAQSYTRGKIGYKSRVLRSRQAGNSPQVINYADRANERLRRRYYKMVLKDGKKYNIAKTAIARELACFIWGMMTDNIY